MKNFIFCVLFGALGVLIIPASAFANAVNINVVSDGRGIDGVALQKVRRTVGNAVAIRTVDNFIVNSPKKGGPIPIEGGLFACAEIGFSASKQSFDGFIKRLGAIQPRPGTTISLQRIASCLPDKEPSLTCGGITGKACPSGQACMDDPSDNCDPKNGGADCSGICKPEPVFCTQEVKVCPDGSSVGRRPPSCDFASCPPLLTK